MSQKQHNFQAFMEEKIVQKISLRDGVKSLPILSACTISLAVLLASYSQPFFFSLFANVNSPFPNSILREAQTPSALCPLAIVVPICITVVFINLPSNPEVTVHFRILLTFVSCCKKLQGEKIIPNGITDVLVTKFLGSLN